MTEEKEIFHHYLKNTGNKITGQRDVILKVFLEAKGHLSAEEIHHRARAEDPMLGFTTVYRTMKLLVECGIARSERFNDGHMRYENDFKRHLLSIPQQMGRRGGNPASTPANQEKNANGLTARQQMMFDNSDINKDGKISRDEILGSQARRASNAYLAMAVVAHAKACDVNGDGRLNLDEFGLLYGVKPGGKLPPQAETRFKGRDGSRASIDFRGLWQMLHHDPKAELDAMDRHITELEKTRKAAPPAGTSDAAATRNDQE